MHVDWWTLTLQTVNALVLIWILARFFFRPVSDIIARRQKEAGKILADADALRRQAGDARLGADRVQAEVAAAREQLIDDARHEAERKRSELVAQAASDIAKLRTEAEASIACDRAAMETAVIEHASRLSVDIALRLLQRVSPNADLDVFLKAACAQARQLSPQMRAAFTAPQTNGEALEVTTAVDLSAEEASCVRLALEHAFGTALTVAFRCDPRVVAGIELHSPHASIRSSWREDLDRIGKELSSDAKR